MKLSSKSLFFSSTVTLHMLNRKKIPRLEDIGELGQGFWTNVEHFGFNGIGRAVKFFNVKPKQRIQSIVVVLMG